MHPWIIYRVITIDWPTDLPSSLEDTVIAAESNTSNADAAFSFVSIASSSRKQLTAAKHPGCYSSHADVGTGCQATAIKWNRFKISTCAEIVRKIRMNIVPDAMVQRFPQIASK